MMNQRNLMGIVILVFFLGLSFYNFKIRWECLYLAKFSQFRAILIAVATALFIGIAYFWGKYWLDYIIALSGGLLLLSSQIGQGIHPKGIFYLSGGRLRLLLIPWENAQDLVIDYPNNKLITLVDTRYPLRVYPNQQYSEKGLEELIYRSKR